jgi:threonine dehydrogenase-like Zn-dependent dehydrogenase
LHDGGEVGFEHPGGYAGYFLTETDKLHFLPDDFPMAAAALIEPLAVATRALRRFRLTDKSSALVIGDGPLGLLLTILLKRAGVCGVTVTGGRENRLALAARLGAERTLNYHHFRDGGTGVVRKALGMSFPNIIEASGSAAAANMAVELASGMARVLFVGDYKKARTDFIWNHLLINELELIGSNASAQAWPEAVRTALAVQKSLSELISAEYPAGQFAAAFDALKHNRDLIKVILRWDRCQVPR